MHFFNQDKFYSEQTVAPAEVDEVTECMQLLIDHVKNKYTKSFLKKNEFKTILIDLEEIRNKSEAAYQTIFFALTMYPASYADIGRQRNVSKVAVFKSLNKLAVKYDWIADVVDVMRRN